MKKVSIKAVKKMPNFISTSTQFLFLTLIFVTNGCNDSKTTKRYTMNSQFKEYFVNFEVGTKWIYEDTISHSMDTIELISKNGEGWNSKDESAEGYRLVFEAKKNRNFVINSSIANNINYAKLHPEPLSTGANAGTIVWGYKEDKWYDEFFDTITFQRNHFSKVVLSYANCPYYYNCFFGKEGLVFFNEYVLIKTIRP